MNVELKDIFVICVSLGVFGLMLFLRRKQLTKGDIIMMLLKAGAMLFILSVLMYVK